MAALQLLPYVLDVATGSENNTAQTRSRYEVVLKDAQQSHLSEVFQMLRSFYDALHPAVSFRVSGISLDCRAAEDRLFKATIRADALQARRDALRTHRNLRKLLLVAVFPLHGLDGCDARAHAPGSLGYVQPNSVPQAPNNADFALTSMMVFRSFPEQRHSQ